MAEIRRRKKDASEIADDVSSAIKERSKAKTEQSRGLISTGSTMLNLALSGDPFGGYALGTVVHIIGDTHAGKSLLALCMMAEAAHNKKLDKYKLVYEEPESAMMFDVADMFGEKTKDRVEFIPPKKDRASPRTVQNWHDDLMKWKTPFVWVTDSFDALSSEDDLKQESPTKGGWHTEKASVSSQLFPKMVGRIEASDSVFLWISQTRDNIGVTFGNPKTFSGGNAIKFYRSYEIWLAKSSAIKTGKIRGKERTIGNWVKARITKNKFTGRVNEVSFPVYNYGELRGVDDVGSMVNWMIEENFWGYKTEKNEKTGKMVKMNIIETEAPFIDGQVKTIVRHIEENNLENKLKEIVGECWLELEQEISDFAKRKPRY